MTLRIFKDCGEKIEVIKHVTKVLTHSAATGYNGLDIEIHYINENESIKIREKHLDKWDFYSVEM